MPGVVLLLCIRKHRCRDVRLGWTEVLLVDTGDLRSVSGAHASFVWRCVDASNAGGLFTDCVRAIGLRIDDHVCLVTLLLHEEV